MESTANAKRGDMKRLRIGDIATTIAKRLRIGDIALRRSGNSARIPEEVTVEEIIPEEVIVEEILSRLPVKSLLRFKCVSKSWYSLISSKHLIKIHLEKSKIKRIMTVARKSSSSPLMLQHYPLLSSSSPLCGGEQLVDYAFSDFVELRLVGSCHGLICILIDRKYFMLLNPSTRQSKKLPPVLALQKTYDDFMGKNGCISRYGFGFNERTLDYEVYANIYMPDRCISKVYSLKGGGWKKLASEKNSPAARELVKGMIPHSIGDWGRYANGKLHWHVDLGYGKPMPIHAVDLNARLVLQVVNQPPSDDVESADSWRRLGVVDGCLSEQRFYKEQNRLDVWVCSNNDDVWTKRFSICPRAPSRPLFHPISTLPNGEVLFLNCDKCALVIYNPKENKIIYQAVDSPRFLGAAFYVESLVSLHPDPDPES